DICGGEFTDFAVSINVLGPPFFQALGIDDRATNIPGSVDGAAGGLVIDQSGFFFFPNNEEHVIIRTYYLADPGTAGTTSTTAICNIVGNPVTESIVVCCGGASVPLGPNLTTVDGIVTYVTASDQWNFSGAAVATAYDGVTGACLVGCTQSVDLFVGQTAANTTFTEGAGFTMALTYDPTFVSITAIDPGSAITSLNAGLGPDVFMTNDTGSGVSIQAQNTALPMLPIFPYEPDLSSWGAGEIAVTLQVAVDTSSLIGDPIGTSTNLQWGDAGDGVANSVTVICPDRNLIPLDAIDLLDVTIDIVAFFDPNFVRGDCNDDGAVNIADAIWTISGYLSMPPLGPEGPCESACDANDDGGIDIADVAFTLTYRFQGGSPPPAPFPACDQQAGAPCDSYASCP
ncbi:MAG: dockerin type I repeat-containing protein, partial [Planctomycetota bacterium]